jgi:hypothetical protein
MSSIMTLYGTMTNINDVHFWIVTPDGDIVDPDFPEYKLIKTFNGCFGDKLHEEFPVDVQKKLWKYFWKNYVKPAVASGGVDFLKRVADKPEPFHCPLNSYAYMKTHKGCRMAVGRMGWKKTSGGVHWEFG